MQRFEVRFNKGIILPIAYQHLIQAGLYNCLPKEYGEFLHDIGYVGDSHIVLKLFNFSRFLGRYKIKQGTIEFLEPPVLQVSSPLDDLSSYLITGLLKQGLQTGEEILQVESISPIPFEPTPYIQFISPVIARKNEPDKVQFHSPWDEAFQRVINDNIRKKYEVIRQLKYNGVGIKLLPLSRTAHPNNRIIVKFKSTSYLAWQGIFQLEGDRNLIETAFYAGLGQKSSQGFGMFRFVR